MTASKIFSRSSLPVDKIQNVGTTYKSIDFWHRLLVQPPGAHDKSPTLLQTFSMTWSSCNFQTVSLLGIFLFLLPSYPVYSLLCTTASIQVRVRFFYKYVVIDCLFFSTRFQAPQRREPCLVHVCLIPSTPV